MPLPARRGSLITGTTSSGGGGGGGSSVFINVKDHGVTGNGTTSDIAAINAVVTYAHGLPAGGGTLYFPGGKYKIDTAAFSIPTSPAFSNLTILGDGDSTILQFTSSAMPAGSGCIDIHASNLIFEKLVLDGGVLTSTQLDWSTITDPMQANLTQGSMVWIHGGAGNIRFSRVTFSHTGGYAALLDATSGGDINGVEFDGCHFVNNRAHTFGSGGVNTYQSWTSGIHYQGDGTTNCVRNLYIHDCQFRRSPGSQIWGHLYAFTRMHKQIHVDSCLFEDVGLEGCEVGGVDGFSVTNCHFHRTGFVTGNSDLSAATPAWLANHQGTALDTSGLATNGVYSANTFLNCNGGYIDMDGFGQGTVTGNSCVCSQPGEPEYVEDQVASFGPGGAGAQYTYGINCDNTSGQSLGGASNIISDNFLSKLGGGAIRLYAARNCKVSGNNINHLASGFLSPPITYGPISASANQRANSNVITDNVINWNPGSMAAAILEDPSVTPFLATDKNWVYGNQWGIGSNVYEFKKDANSGAVTRVVFSSSVAALTTSSESWISREGTLAAPITRWYRNLNGVSVALMTLQDAGTYATAPATPGPLLNITNGAGSGGVLTTGARTTLAYDDAVASGKGYFDSHLALTDTTRVQADEDILSATTGAVTNVALLRYRPSVGFIQQSITITTGVRNWVPLALSIGGTDKQIQFNDGGVLGGSTNFTFDKVTQIVTIAGITATAGLLVNNSYVQSAQGFVTTSAAYNSIQSPSGGFLGAGVGIAAALSKGGYVDIAPLSYGGLTPFPVPIGVLGSFGATDALLWVAPTNNTPSPVTTQQLQTNIAINSAVGFATGNNLINSIQALVGGVSAKWLVASDSLFFLQEAAPALSGTGQSRVYMDSTTHTLLVSMNNGAYVPLVSGSSAAGSNTQIQYNSAGVFAASANLTWTNGAQAVTITGIALTAGLSVLNAYISADGGFTTPSTSYQSIQSPSGGVLTSGVGVTNAASKGGYIDFALIGYAAFPNPLTSASFAATDVLLWNCGSNGTVTPVTTTGLNTNAFINAASGFVTLGTAVNVIQAPNGGVTAKFHFVSDSLFFSQLASAPALSGAGQVRIYANTSGQMFSSTAGGAYVPFGISTVPAGSNTQVQFNNSGVFGASANFVWTTGTNVLTITGSIQATLGFNTSGVADNIIQAPSGGVSGRRIISTFDIVHTGVTTGSAPTGAAGQGKIYFDTTLGKWRATEGTNAAVNLISGGSPGGSDTHVQYNSSGTFAGSANFTWTNGSQVLTLAGSVQASLGYNTSGAADNIIQAPNGGVTARRHIATFDIVHTGVTTGGAPTGASGQGKLFYDTTLAKWRVIEGTNAAVNMLSGGGSPGGADTQIQYNNVGAFGGSANHVWSNSLQRMTVFGITNTAGIAVGNGFVQSDGGYLVTSTNTAYNTIQSSGGLVVKGALQVGASYTFDQSAAANGWLLHTMVVNNTGGVTMDVYDTSGGSPFILPALVGRKIVGTPGSTIFGLPINSFIFSFGARGSFSGGVTTSASAKINVMTTEAWTSGAQGAEIQFATTANGTPASSAVNRLYIRNTGTVEIMSGMYAHFGLQSDGFISYIANGSTPSSPSSGYGGFTYRSGSTWWYYNSSTFSWNFVDFAGGGGGGVTSINAGSGGLTGALTFTASGGLTVGSVGSSTIAFSASGVALLAASNAFTGLSNTFSSAVTFVSTVTLGAAGVVVGGTICINTSKQFVGNGVDVGMNGVACRAVNPRDSGGVLHTGIDTTISGHTFVGGICIS